MFTIFFWHVVISEGDNEALRDVWNHLGSPGAPLGLSLPLGCLPPPCTHGMTPYVLHDLNRLGSLPTTFQVPAYSSRNLLVL
ncbi:hypothetical protein LIER_34258 [Lithospermum erythrorhizon]|uniref:Uncharacterized protein n=1 Tax=Lithospermum erythrorhizon TaxID=34254 RepID=A0AAV3S1D7_LITER